MTSRSQRALAAELLDAALAVSERTRTLRNDLDPAQLDWTPPPPDGGWSIGQIFEHLCVSHDSYLVPMRRMVGDALATSPPTGGDAIWRPTLVGGMLTRSMMTTRKLPAPRAYRPTTAPRPEVIDAFLERQEELAGLLRAAAPLEWRRLRMGSPVLSIIRMNLGDAFSVLVRHAERHLRQAEGRRAHPAFPRPVAAHR